MDKTFEKIDSQLVLAALGIPKTAVPEYALIDVRSPYEFGQGAISGFSNFPILSDSERQQVGIAFRNQGSEAAIVLGHALVGPSRQERVASWTAAIAGSRSKKGVVLCWRGGMRSETACRWITEAGFEALQVTGGYKSLRRALTARFISLPPFWVLAGMTGVGKTEVIGQLGEGAIDLEGIAKHRGSAFGASYKEPQPAQATFENGLALELQRFMGVASRHPTIIEDESRNIGRLCLPDPLFQKILTAPLIEIDATLGERSKRIFAEYVLQPLTEGMTLEVLESVLLHRLGPLMRRLDRWAVEIRSQLVHAFRQGTVYEDHRIWIESLLQHYYDARYHHARSRAKRELLFKGTKSEVLEWIVTRQVNGDAEKT